MFKRALETGFKDDEFKKLNWWEIHKTTERHHLNDFVPEDVKKETTSADDVNVNPAVSDFFSSEVNLIDDINNAPKEPDVKVAEKKKKNKIFGVLKFGDDYNIEDDNDK